MAGKSRGEPLDGQDGVWLHMEEPGDPMVIVALLRLAGTLEVGALREFAARRLLAFAPFRRTIVDAHLGAARWEEAEVDRCWHVVEERLPAGEAALQSRLGELLAAHLDPDRPPWRFHLLQQGGRGSALVVRIHHAVGDGMALLHLLLSLTEGGGAALPGPRRRPSGMQPIERLKQGAEGAAALGRMLGLPPDPDTSLRGAVGHGKAAAWSGTFPLDELKRAARAQGASLNDLLVAALAGALCRHLQRGGEPVAKLRAVLPVDLRQREELRQLGNRFGVVFLELPLLVQGAPDGAGEEGTGRGTGSCAGGSLMGGGGRTPAVPTPRSAAARRLALVHRRMEALKHGPEAVVAFHLLHVVGATAPQLEAPALRFFASKASLYLTNVAGPQARRRLLATEIDDLLFWIPSPGGIGLTASFFSYAGGVRLAVAADRERLPDPNALVADFEVELASLL